MGKSRIVTLDEAHSIFTAGSGGEVSGSRYYAFHLRTESTIRMALPPDYQLRALPPSPTNPSARMPLDPDTLALRGPLQFWDPFSTFPLDLADTVAMEEDPNELCKSISTFCSLEYMRMFGRPLWMSYSIEDILDITQLKLLGGKESDLKYNPLFPAQAFTILSFRVGLAVTLSLNGCSVRSLAREW